MGMHVSTLDVDYWWRLVDIYVFIFQVALRYEVSYSVIERHILSISRPSNNA